MDIYEAFEKCGYLPIVPLPDDMDVSVIPEYVIAVYNKRLSRGTNRENMNNYPESVGKLQSYLKDAHYYNGTIDRYIDSGHSSTIEALQWYLKCYGYYSGECDGKLDDTFSDTVIALQKWMIEHGLYDGPIDGFINSENSDTMLGLMNLR